MFNLYQPIVVIICPTRTTELKLLAAPSLEGLFACFFEILTAPRTFLLSLYFLAVLRDFSRQSLHNLNFTAMGTLSALQKEHDRNVLTGAVGPASLELVLGAPETEVVDIVRALNRVLGRDSTNQKIFDVSYISHSLTCDVMFSERFPQ